MYKIPANTVFVGKNLVFVPECHSTNSLALEMTQVPTISEGTVVITNHQTAGRGQRGNSWEAAAGENLTLSIILKPTFLSVKDQFYLNITMSLAVLEVLRPLLGGSQSKVKWPNDVLIDRKKVCGILIENQIRGSQVSTSVIGIGLNVNQQFFETPTATSIRLQIGNILILQEVLDSLLSSVEACYLKMKSGHYTHLRNKYLENLYWNGEQRIFAAAGREFEGIIVGISDEGKLLVQSDNTLNSYGFKEIAYVR